MYSVGKIYRGDGENGPNIYYGFYYTSGPPIISSPRINVIHFPNTFLCFCWKCPLIYALFPPNGKCILSFCSNQSLFSWESIISMCTVDSLRLRSQPQFKELCETKGPAHCCPGWSLGGYIGLLHKRSSCFGIQVSSILFAVHTQYIGQHIEFIIFDNPNKNVVGWLDNDWPNCKLQWTLTFWENETFFNSFLFNDMLDDPTKTKQVFKVFNFSEIRCFVHVGFIKTVLSLLP